MIVVDKVTKYYGAHAAVRDLDFRIEQGECVGFLGLNGAGKTTTLRMLSCLLLPTSGRVTINGIDVEENPHEIRKLIGFLPDTPPVYPEMRVKAFLTFAGKLRQMEKSHLERRLKEVCQIAGLEDVFDEHIHSLSHGYQQRVGIAQAIIHEPSLLILDEPIQGLDPVQIVEMREMIRGLRGKHTILLSTHILSEIRQTCDRIMMLNDGRIAAEGTEEDLGRRFGAGGAPGAHHVVVELRPEGDLDSLLSEVRELSGVDQVAVAPSDAGDTKELSVQSSEDVREAVARLVIEGGHGLRRLDVDRSSGLESIFLKLSSDETPNQGAGK